MKKKVLLLGAALSMLLAVSAGAAAAPVVTPDGNIYTVEFNAGSTNAKEQFVLLITTPSEGDTLTNVDVDSILYIDQQEADESGNVKFENFQLKTNTNADIYIGGGDLGAPQKTANAIEVTAADVTGTVTLAGRTGTPNGHSGATVTLTDKDKKTSVEQSTDSTGAYTFTAVAPADYTLTVTMPGYLSYTKTTLKVPGGLVPTVKLISGDIDGNGYVTGIDLQGVLAAFGKPLDSLSNKLVDLNGDGFVSGLDLSNVLAGYGQEPTVE